MQITHSLKLGTTFKLLLAAGVVSALAACGGSNVPNTGYPLSIGGTAATGTAIANGAVSVSCKIGSGTATTGAVGSYVVTVPVPAEGPCIVSVTTASGAVLRSIAAGNGSLANVTPLTEMLVSYMAVQSGAGASASPAALAANTNIATIINNPTVLAASVTQVIAVIKAAAGSDVVVPTDFLTATLIPKTSTTTGNAQDQILDLLKTRNVIITSGGVDSGVVIGIQINAGQHTLTGATGGV
jgi:hypothetical protein